MKQAGLYHSLIGLDNYQQEPIVKEEDAGHYQLRTRWFESTITQEHLSALNDKIQVKMLESLRLAKMYPAPHEQILKALTEVNTFIEIRDMYSKEPPK